MCVKDEYKDYLRRDMGIEDFKKITPYLNDVESVVLEGWGESLLHKDLVEFIRLSKQEGPEVGFVTSGMGLDEDYTMKLVNAGIDFVGFSLSGATSKTHNSIRVNSDFGMLINSIKLFRKLSDKNKLKKPKIHIVYLMLADNISEVPLIIELAKTLGIEEVVLINIIQISNARQDSEKVFTCENEESHSNIMDEARTKAKQLKIKLTAPYLSPHDVAVCSENPLRNLYISVDGEISPCVYLYPPIPSPFKRIFCGEELTVEKISFGNIFRESFETIWNRKEYVEFRDCFARRKKRIEETYQALFDMKKPETLELKEPPSPCKTCHKMLGV
jgi:MoaA/NifB/PqqE/SkfB family radical SAM enzyme